MLAKRYLCFAEEGYFDTLSEGSVATLAFQGGAMSQEEAHIFEKSCDHLPFARPPRVPSPPPLPCVSLQLRRCFSQAAVRDVPDDAALGRGLQD